MLLLVGLGNPGPGHAGNRHNIGFMAVDEIMRRHGFGPARVRFHGLAADGAIAGEKTVGGAPYKWEEVTPGSPNDPCQWEVFLQACKEIGYDGYLSHEQCSPIIIKGHKLGDLATIDQRYIEARAYFRNLLKKLDCYTGHRA